MSWKYTFEITLHFEDEKKVKQVYEAITPEKMQMMKKRSETDVMLKKDMLSILIRAEDLTALRASFNVYLKPILLSKSLLEVF